jgi:hypothetical protein
VRTFNINPESDHFLALTNTRDQADIISHSNFSNKILSNFPDSAVTLPAKNSLHKTTIVIL